MSIQKNIYQIVGCSLLLLSMFACTQLPTEKKEVADIRPSISFSVAPNMDPNQSRVFVDNLDMGFLASYLSGIGALKVLSGSHTLRIDVGGQTIFQENIYLSDGATRTILVRPQ